MAGFSYERSRVDHAVKDKYSAVIEAIPVASWPRTYLILLNLVAQNNNIERKFQRYVRMLTIYSMYVLVLRGRRAWFP